MKKNVLKFILMAFIAIPMIFLASCGDDEPDPDPGNDFLPVLNDNFSFEVDGNDVNFTTTLTGNVWVTNNDVDYQFVDQAVTVNLPNEGTYSFTCSSLGSGEQLTSEPFNVEITVTDVSFLNEGLWLYLSGGANETKTWRLDMTADAEVVYFDGPLSFSGYADGDTRMTEWAYWAFNVLPEELPFTVNGVEQASFFNWQPGYKGNEWIMAPGDYGTITFDGTNKTASMTDVTGATSNGSFTFDDETWIMNLTGVVLPIDTMRLNEPQYTDEHLAEVRIFTLTDSAMQIGIRRTYEGFAEDGSQNASEWINVYNFIVDDYEYPVNEEPDPEEPVLTSFTANDLVGTWKYASVPFDWIGWAEQNPLNNWADQATMLGTDWLGLTQDDIDVAEAQEFVFNNDGSCDLAGTATTYSVADGVITFADSVGFQVGAHWFTISGTTYNALDVQGASVEGGLWIGYQNETKLESAAVHFIKQ